MWPSFLWEFPFLFSTVKFRYKYSQFIHRLKILILKCWSWTVYASKFFLIHERHGKLGFFKIQKCTSSFFFEAPLPSYCILSNGEDSASVRHKAKERRSRLFLIKLLVFKKKCEYHNVGNNLFQFKSWKYCFRT